MGAGWPTWLGQLHPGLDDEGIEQLRGAVAPYFLPPQVEALYRWHGGGDQGVFGGWRMRPLDELIEFYRFTIDALESPPSWLPVFDAQIVNVVTLDLPGLPPSDPSVWYGHTHDGFLARLFDSVEALVDVVSDAAEAGVLVEQSGRLGLDSGEYLDALDGFAWSSWRLARSPGSFRSPDPPAGTLISRQPEPDWPREWLVSVGVTDESLALTGATHTIAQLISAATAGPVRGTIRGKVVTGAGGGGWWSPVVDDGTGRIAVSCDTRLLPISIVVGQEGEFDVLLESAHTPEPIVDEDPQVAAIANRLRPALPIAKASAARPIPE